MMTSLQLAATLGVAVAIGACLDTTIDAPTAPRFAAVQSPTSATRVTLRGIKQAGTALRVDGAELMALGPEQTFSVDVALVEGGNRFSFVAVDAAGQRSQAASVGVTSDTQPPPGPRVDAVPAQTFDDAVNITGTKAAAAILFVNGAAVAAATGSLTFTVAVPLALGANTIRLATSDEVQNESAVVVVNIERLLVTDVQSPLLGDVVDARVHVVGAVTDAPTSAVARACIGVCASAADFFAIALVDGAVDTVLDISARGDLVDGIRAAVVVEVLVFDQVVGRAQTEVFVARSDVVVAPGATVLRSDVVALAPFRVSGLLTTLPPNGATSYGAFNVDNGFVGALSATSTGARFGDPHVQMRRDGVGAGVFIGSAHPTLVRGRYQGDALVVAPPAELAIASSAVRCVDVALLSDGSPIVVMCVDTDVVLARYNTVTLAFADAVLVANATAPDVAAVTVYDDDSVGVAYVDGGDAWLARADALTGALAPPLLLTDNTSAFANAQASDVALVATAGLDHATRLVVRADRKAYLVRVTSGALDDAVVVDDSGTVNAIAIDTDVDTVVLAVARDADVRSYLAVGDAALGAATTVRVDGAASVNVSLTIQGQLLAHVTTLDGGVLRYRPVVLTP